MDENTIKLVDVPDSRTLKLEGKPRVLATMENVERVLSQFNGKHIVSIGSGSLTDIAKCAAHLKGAKFSSFPTAPSVDGYTSSIAAISINGEKTTLQATTPNKVVIDPKILIKAPSELVKAGIGDICAKFTARLDWKLSNLVTGESICDLVWEELKVTFEKVLMKVESILKKDEKTILELMRALLISGLNITVVGNSRPASGAEHLISHSFEMYHELRGETPMYHGLQVAIGTFITMKAYKMIFENIELRKMNIKDEERFSILKRLFKERIATKFMRTYERKTRVDQIELERVKEVLYPTYVQFHKKIESVLEQIGVKELLKSYDPELIQKITLVANTIRDRYTILDLLDELSLLKDFSSKIFEL
ncbi:MAG: iron-containing alcohol dehydrogenase [Pseudothermotoga sp.]|nr:iron-containing alcohol dehydrogenase [Pseudothermotoga sp.]MDW8139242.1 iron-containing alcohol dehydrogenase [Pseudothermotoga sp.]